MTFFGIEGATFQQLMSLPAAADLSRHGGSAMMLGATTQLGSDLRSASLAGGAPIFLQNYDAGTPPEGAAAQAAFWKGADRFLQEAVAECGTDQLVIVAALPPHGMPVVQARSRLSGVVVAWDPGAEQPGTPGALTSSSTRRAGVVTADDLRATIAAYLRLPGVDTNGTITVVRGSPLDLYERHVAQRRMYVPVAIVAGSAVFLLLVFALYSFSRRTKLPRWALYVGQWACLATPALAVALLAAGHLPTLSYLWVALLAVAVTILLPAAALAFRGRGALVPPFALGLMILGLFVVEAATGWYGTMSTMMGGTALDGARFYGLPNAFEGLVIGSAVYVASSLKPLRGFAAIIAVALFVGLPGLGADLGGAVAALAAAGLWLMLRTRNRFGWKEAGVALSTVVFGTGVILLAHRFLVSSPTHGTAFVETSGRDPLHAASTLWERLGIGVRLLRRNPIGLVYLAATPVLIRVVVKRRAGLKDSLNAFPQWRAAILAILWASVVGYFVNDTGVSAVGMGFAMALGGLLYVPLAREAVKMNER